MDTRERVLYWPGVLLVGLIALCTVVTIALGLVLWNDVRAPLPDGSPIVSVDPDAFNCGPARILLVGQPSDELMEMRALVDKEPYDLDIVAFCRAVWRDTSPGVALLGASALALFLTCAVMFTVQVRAGLDQPLRPSTRASRPASPAIPHF